MEPQHYISLGSLGFTVLVGLFGAFRYLSAIVDSLRRELADTQEKMRLLVEKESQAQSKARHDASNAMQLAYAGIVTDMKQLSRESVRKDEMQTAENRMFSRLDKIESKVDRLADGFNELAAVKMAISGVVARLDKLSAKFNTD